jgi:TPR repeat protein
LAEAAPPNGDVSERLDPDLAPMNETAAAESITAGVGTHALSADLDEASLGSDSAMASPAAVSASAAVASPGVAAAPDPVAPPPASPAPGSPAAAPAGSREAPAARSAPPAEVARVVDRGDQVLVTGDIAAARLLYGWAASTGDARAALALGKTHDPLYLALLRARGPWADREMAIEWYAIAAARGSREAAARLASLTEKSDDSAGGAR